jgi:hypothetical protein
MSQTISRIFKDNLFKTRKSTERDWEQIADKAGEELYSEIASIFPDPEIALCGTIHVLAELVMCQPDADKRKQLLDCLTPAISERLAIIEAQDEEEPEDYDIEQSSPRRRPRKHEEEDFPIPSPNDPEMPEDDFEDNDKEEGEEEEEEEEEEEVDPEDEVDFKKSDDDEDEPPNPDKPIPEGDEEDEDDNGDDDSDESFLNNKRRPTDAAGYQKRRSRKE